jgi:putative RNA 2'-phosphotransferase
VRDKIERMPVTPPAILYHGTTPQAAVSIRTQGLKPMQRQYVHLSADVETAILTGRRRTNRPVILKIAALEAHRHGIAFYQGNDQVWLADFVPPQYIT